MKPICFTSVLIGTALIVAVDASPITPYETWTTTYFDAAEVAAGLAMYPSTPNADNVTNLIKYSAGVDPWKYAEAFRPTVKEVNGHLELTYWRVVDATDICYTVEVSDDLETWTSGPSYTFEIDAIADGNGREMVTVKDLEPIPEGGNRFIRLRIDRAIREGFDTDVLPAADDSSSVKVDLPFTIEYFGTIYSSMFINQNGNITFNNAINTFTPVHPETSGVTVDLIAPFWADVDTRVGEQIKYGSENIDGRDAFGVGWINVGYYREHEDKLNSFQLVIIDRSDRSPGDYDIEFNYGQITWEAGDASGGHGGSAAPHPETPNGGTAAFVGFIDFDYTSYTTSSFYEHDGSFTHGALLDTNAVTGLVHGSFNSSVCGRYVFRFHDGIPIDVQLEVP